MSEGGCWAKTKSFISSFMVYDTVSIVRISDMRLAILHYLCMICILIYIFIYTIWWNQAYYAIEAPVGTVRINPMAPSERDDDQWKDIQELPYCLTENRTTLHGYDLLPCKYFDSLLDVFPQAVDSAITIASRIKFSTQTCNNIYFNTSNTTWTNNQTESYFLADIERFTLQLDHTFYAPNLGIQHNARDLKGFVVKNGEEKDDESYNKTFKPYLPKGEIIGQVGQLDIVSVGSLLRMAGVDIDAQNVTPGESIRNSGAIFLVFLDYQNSMTHWFTNGTKYTIHVDMINNTEYKAVQTVYTKKLDGGRTIYNRHGLHFVFLQTGKLVQFDFQVLLLSMVSGMGMLAFSTTIVDLISTKLLGNKDVVSNLKYKTTPNLTQFSDDQLERLALKLRHIQEQELKISDESSQETSVSMREPLVDREYD